MTIQAEQLDPVAAAVLQGPRDESQLRGRVVQSAIGVDGDLPQLFCLRDGIDDMPRSGRDEVDHLQPLSLHRFFHEDVSLEEDILVPHTGDGRNNAGVRRVVDRIEHVQPEFLMLGKGTDLDE